MEFGVENRKVNMFPLISLSPCQSPVESLSTPVKPKSLETRRSSTFEFPPLADERKKPAAAVQKTKTEVSKKFHQARSLPLPTNTKEKKAVVHQAPAKIEKGTLERKKQNCALIHVLENLFQITAKNEFYFYRYLPSEDIASLFLTARCFWVRRLHLLKNRGDVIVEIFLNSGRSFRAIPKLLQRAIKDVADTIQSFEVSHVRFKSQDFDFFLTHFKKLQHVKLIDCDLTNLKAQRLIDLSELVTLDLSQNTWLSSDTILRISLLRKLKFLGLQGCFGIANEDMRYIGYINSLEALDIGGCSALTGENFASLTRLPFLRTISVSACLFSDGVFESHRFPKNLIHLNIASITTITDKALECIGKLVHLRMLNAQGCTGFSDKGLVHLTALKELEQLDISDLINVTDIGMTSVGALVTLKWLNLESCFQITNVGLREIRKLKKLTYLNISKLENISNKSMKSVAHCVHLQFLYLSGCFLITGRGLRKLPVLRHVKDLDLSHLEHMEDQAIIEITRIFPQLEWLNLTNCSSLTDKSMEQLRKLHRLRILVLDKCNITAKGLLEIIHSDVRYINLVDCPKLKRSVEEMRLVSRLLYRGGRADASIQLQPDDLARYLQELTLV
jgi:hypothetical protein